jgi:predicted RND superfamily exporter protein
MSARIAAFIWRWRLLLTGLILAGAVAAIPRVNITRIDNDITAWFSRQDPVFLDYERFRSEFGGTRSLIIALRADSADRLFSRATLAFIDRVSGDIERVDTVQRVSSLATATIVKATDDGGLDVRPLLEDLDRSGPQEVRRRALDDELIRGDLVSDDATVTALVVNFDEDRIDQVRSGIIQRIHAIVDPQLPAGVRAYYNGSLEISETYNRVTLDNQRKFTPPILLFTLGAIYLTFRSWRKTLLATIGIGVSVLWTLGLYTLMGFTYNVLSSMLVPLIVVLAIADDVHMMQHWDEERRHGDTEHAFKATVAHLTAPLLGASATTALGMASLATSNVVAVRAFGIGSAVGIMVDFAISLVLVPTLMTFLKPELEEAPHEQYLIGPLQRIARFSTGHPTKVVWVSLTVGGIAALGMFRLHVDTNHINFFRTAHPLSQSAAVIDNELSGIYSFQIMLEGPAESLRTPDALQRIEHLEAQLRTFPHVRKVTSIVDYVKRINKELHDGKPEAAVVPASAEAIAQELLVFTLGGEGRHELERIVASDYSRAQISVKLESMSSDVVLEQVERSDALARATFAGTGITALTTGSGRLFSTLDHYLVTSQLSSFATAFFTVFGVIFVVFRSARFGILTIVPNVLPVLAVLGIMGFLNISMNVATVMLASVALGVVDDDTIHFINRYRREVAAGASTDAAIEIATAHEGRASLSTAMINSCGFGVLLFSEYRPTAWFGGLLALTMAVAFLAEVFILPATIKLMPRIFGADALRRPLGAPGLKRAVASVFKRTLPVIAILAGLAGPALAQTPTGDITVTPDFVPNRHDTAELRTRIFAEEVLDPSPKLVITLSGFAEGLLARRPIAPRFGRVTRKDAIFRVQDASIAYKGDRVDVLAGYTRVVWGRLDELQPTDVVNPLDVSRFFFDGRSEARLPVALVRARGHISENASIEGVYVPFFRRGRFDQLDEGTSPFNIEASFAASPPACRADLKVSTTDAGGAGRQAGLPAAGCPSMPFRVVREEPSRTLGNAQGGGRFNATSGRVDWSVSAYRGIEPFGLGSIALPSPLSSFVPVEILYPRFTLVGGDFETVRGQWGVRGEIAAFVEDNFQDPALRIVQGSSLDAGAGVDRRAGDYRISGSALVHRESYDTAIADESGRTDVSLILAADRAFARERYHLRTFGVYNPSESSGFARAIATAKLRDNVALEGSGGWFIGDGRDVVGRFADSDFVYARLRCYF